MWRFDKNPETGLEEIFFWSDLKKPQSFVLSVGAREQHREKIETVAAILRAGARGMAYRGFAECRICKARLGTADLTGWGFVWPEKAEHYLLAHGVWVPADCEALLQRYKLAHRPRTFGGR